MARWGAAAAVGVSAALIASCGASASVDGADVERQIGAALTTQVGGRFSVECPADIPAEEGYTFACEVTDTDGGGTVQVTVVEEDAAGAFTWRVTTGSPSGGSTSAPSPQ